MTSDKKAPAYFTEDGNYGSAKTNDIIIIETENWTGAMWDEISSSSDLSRLRLAEHFEAGKHDFTSSNCPTCELTAAELGLK